MSNETPKLIPWTEADPEEAAVSALTEALRDADGPADLDGAWPETLWRLLTDAGATRWSIPAEFGGGESPRPLLVQRYARLAEASLTAVFILSQHDAAVRRLVAAIDRPIARRWLAALAGGAPATVGLSQLTTSRRLGSKALTAVEIGDGRYRLDGGMPWVTAAERAEVIVTGAFLEDDRQMLLALPADLPGVLVKPAFDLAALQASRTAEVVVNGVEIDAADVLMGPSTEISSQPGAVGTAGLETSALALGQSAAAIGGLVEALAIGRDDLADPLTGQAEPRDQPVQRCGEHVQVARVHVGAPGPRERDPVAPDDDGAAQTGVRPGAGRALGGCCGCRSGRAAGCRHGRSSPRRRRPSPLPLPSSRGVSDTHST